jgi:hypothetical protein
VIFTCVSVVDAQVYSFDKQMCNANGKQETEAVSLAVTAKDV